MTDGYYNIRIQYVYAQEISRQYGSEVIVHQILDQQILKHLERRHFILQKDDIVALLNQDGAQFDSSSLRIYEPDENSYIQIPDGWKLEVDRSEPEFTLLFWIGSKQQKIKESNHEEVLSQVSEIKTYFSTYREEMRSVIKKEIQLITHDFSKQMTLLDEKLRSKPKLDAKSSSKIDIALMYSEPLVKLDVYGRLALGDPVDFEEECNKIIDFLKENGKQTNIYFEVATLANLFKVLSQAPLILHIICHGDFSKNNGRFFLCFEDDGKLKEVYADNLRKKMIDLKLQTKIVFVNACHSEEVAKVFSEAGVPCVITVQSDLKIEDGIAQEFSKAFYWQLFDGKSVQEAFDWATRTVSDHHVYTCCCAHTHKPNCNWYKIYKTENSEKAHYLHVPTCSNCKYDNKFHHRAKCGWALNFLIDVCQQVPPKGIINACCCSPELEHNESMKFKIICTDNTIKDEAFFKEKMKGKVHVKSSTSCVEQRFQIKRLTGRNKELFDMYEALKAPDIKLINLFGPEGIGKSSLSKQIANYLFERHYFRDKIVFISLDRTLNMAHFKAELFKEFPGAYDVGSLSESMKTIKALLILDKCDKFLHRNCDGFVSTLTEIINTVRNTKFIIITTEKIKLFYPSMCYVEIRELKKIDAAKLLCRNAANSLSINERNPYFLESDPLLDLVPLTPQSILLISEQLKGGRSLTDIKNELERERKQNIGSLTDSHDDFLRSTLE